MTLRLVALVWAGAKKYEFSFLLCAGPLNEEEDTAIQDNMVQL